MTRERRPDERGRADLGRDGPRLLLAVGAAAVLAVTGCEDGGGLLDPDPGGDDPQQPTAPSTDLTFLRQSADAPPFFQFDGDTSFVATRGQETEIEIAYEDSDDPGQAGDEYLEFELDEESLSAYPDGTPFQAGDTVTITISFSGDTILADFEPSGLEFDPDEPAELEMRFRHADRDTDGDGDDDLDEREGDVRLWKQEQPGDDWLQFSEEPDVSLDRVRADITSFTRWALAF